MSEIISTTGRSSGTIAAEIRTIVRQTRMIVLQNAIEIGKRLCEAKELVPRGEWGEYLEKEVEFSKSTANNMMQLFREYGNNQQSLFGGNSDAFLELPYTKALKLLAVPEEEREEFADQVDAEHISTRELEKAIRERDEAQQREQAAKELNKIAQENFEAERDKVEQLTTEAKRKELDADNARKEVSDLKKKLNEAKKQLKKAEAENGKVPEDVMERLRKDAEAAAAKMAMEGYTAKVAEAERKAEEAAKRAKQAEAKLEEAKKARVAGDSDTAVFGAYFAEVQEQFNKMHGLLLKVKGTDAEKAVKLKGAVTALLEKMEEKVRDI